ncbi:hypothetical protein BV898_19620 [Hypsibius exemplaris]|uniref:Uncharacterized protein n=1 Tax=Hypsibius exemplaris TaxID=2072580 RepID=A0A9X6NK09_HYPEX|nr:hypothetical protein BV898_19620 [Hypsibius exemplaris]
MVTNQESYPDSQVQDVGYPPRGQASSFALRARESILIFCFNNVLDLTSWCVMSSVYGGISVGPSNESSRIVFVD